MTDDVIGFPWWWKDGIRHYGCRGIGPKYTYFYRVFAPSSSYRSTSEDFPWDYFVFDDPADHERLVSLYPNDVWEEEYEDEDD